MKQFNKKIILLSLLIVIVVSSPIVMGRREGFESKIDFLRSSTFKPECCPNVYTNSSGCLCNTNGEHALLITRGGNRFMDDCLIR